MNGIKLCLVAALAPAIMGAAAETPWPAPVIPSLAAVAAPTIACSPTELKRLKDALNSGPGPARDAVRELVSRADAALKKPVEFPPKGGQHNTFYQCRKCEVGLKTLSDTQHQCPVCQTVYSGPPYDEALYKQRHGELLSRMLALAWGYAVTGDEKYAARAREILVGYADRYLKYPYHGSGGWNFAWNASAGGRLYEQTLSEASAMALQIAPTYDLLYNSRSLTSADHDHIRADLIRPMLENIDKHRVGMNNWQTWHNAAMFAGGVALRDPQWLTRAIYGSPKPAFTRVFGDWADAWKPKDPRTMPNGFIYQMETAVSSEGMWYERTWGYHFYALEALVSLAENARRLGLDLWRHPNLKKMFDLPAAYVMPDGSLPRFGDSVDTLVTKRDSLYEPAYAAFHDPTYLAVLPTNPTWRGVALNRTPGGKTAATTPKPRLTSRVFPNAGHVILRTAGEAGLVTAFTYGSSAPFHAHYDVLSLVLFGFGGEIGVDPGHARNQAYRLPVHKDWYKATVSHNAVLVDGRSQNPGEGALERFAATDSFAILGATSNAVCPDVNWRRYLFQTPEYLLIADRLTSSRSFRADWLWHDRGALKDNPAASATACPTPAFPGEKYIKALKSGTTDAPIRATFSDALIALNAAPGSTVTSGEGPNESVQQRVPFLAVTREGAEVLFAAVVRPIAKNRSPAPATDRVDAKMDGGAVVVTVLTADNRLDLARFDEKTAAFSRDGRQVLSTSPSAK